MAGWHHLLEGHGFVWTPGVGDVQGGLECCDSWGHKESDRTEQLNWTELPYYLHHSLASGQTTRREHSPSTENQIKNFWAWPCPPEWDSVSPSVSLSHQEVSISFFPDSSVGKESTCNAGDPSSIPRLRRSPRKGIGYPLQYSWASLVAQLVKNLSAMRETWVRSLGWEYSLEKGRATHSSVLAWRIPWTVQSIGSQRVWHDWVTLTLHKPLIFLHHSYSSADIWATTAALSV